MKIEKEYGLIGYPLTHSFSRDYFENKFKQENIPAEYINFELEDIGDLIEAIAEHPMLQGFNVTVPYKELVMPYLAEIDESARAVGAVNVVKIDRTDNWDFILKGYNTDMPAFKKSLSTILTKNVESALILGTGGASKAVKAAITSMGKEVKTVSRSKDKGDLTYEELTDEIVERNQLVVNTTPVGMYPNIEEYPPFPFDYLTPSHVCMDIIYNPAVTSFLKKSAIKGAAIKNGLEMLLLQAEMSWDIWNR